MINDYLKSELRTREQKNPTKCTLYISIYLRDMVSDITIKCCTTSIHIHK